MSDEDLNETLDNLVGQIQCDFLVDNPEIIGEEHRHPEYYRNLAYTFQFIADYFGQLSSAYDAAATSVAKRLSEEAKPVKDRINDYFSIRDEDPETD